jgi:putative glutamine amidotransferase
MPSRRPVIGITVGTSSTKRQTPRFGTNQVYVRAVEGAGGIAVLIPPMPKRESIELLDRLDGLLIPGGADADPSLYGEAPAPSIEEWDRPRDDLELALIRAAEKRGMSVFGVCRGQQLINIAHGGTLFQDIKTETGSRIKHRSPKSRGRDYLAHEIEIDGSSWFAETARSKHLTVNSLHHQAARSIGRGLHVTAWSSDGIIEGLETADRRVVAVQCHPEELTEIRWARNLFGSFVASCRD